MCVYTYMYTCIYIDRYMYRHREQQLDVVRAQVQRLYT